MNEHTIRKQLANFCLYSLSVSNFSIVFVKSVAECSILIRVGNQQARKDSSYRGMWTIIVPNAPKDAHFLTGMRLPFDQGEGRPLGRCTFAQPQAQE
jgi:hypothetical protein